MPHIAHTLPSSGGQASSFYNGSVNSSETFPRGPAGAVFSNAQALAATGIMSSYAILLSAGQVITSLNWKWGTTAGVTPTHWWGALYDTQATPALIAQTADQLTAAQTASAAVTLALAAPAPYTVPTTGIYYVSIMCAGATIPTVWGCASVTTTTGPGLFTGQKTLSVSSGSALTTTAPGTIASPAALASAAYIMTS